VFTGRHSKHKRLFKTAYNGVYGQFECATAFNSNIKNRQKALEINSQIAENNLINEK
jgi:cobalt-zinc-cadmium resistance protein CzcA